MPDRSRADIWREMRPAAAAMFGYRPDGSMRPPAREVARAMDAVSDLTREARGAGYDIIDLYGQALIARANRRDSRARGRWARVIEGLAELICADLVAEKPR